MNVGCWNYNKNLNIDNFMFHSSNAPIGDDLLKPFNILYERAKEVNIRLQTLDTVQDYRNLDALLFVDFPGTMNGLASRALKLDIPKYLVIFESQLIRPDNWKINKHALFRKIFTWNDDFVDNHRYFKINFSHLFPETITMNISGRKLCNLIAGNKKVYHPLELYSKRVEAIRWFETNHPADFDLFGVGWDAYRFSGPKVIKALNKIKPLTRLLASHYPSYRGTVLSKRECFSRYKFSICYENARDLAGYITEKIFDCFFGGCVPVYWGAHNVTDHIPASCFIDKRCFNSYEDLYSYMKNLDEDAYLSYLNSIVAFLKSDKAYQFSTEAFAGTILREIQQ